MSKKNTPKEISIRSSAGEYLTYISALGDQEQAVEMRYANENIWLTQKMMAELYGVCISAINQHLKKLLEENEIDNSVIKQYLITANDHKQAKLHAETQFEKYRIIQDKLFESDFDRFMQLGNQIR